MAAKVTVEDVEEGARQYIRYCLQFGNNVVDGGDAIMGDLGLDPDIRTLIKNTMNDPEAISGWLFGFTFAFWLMREKRGL